MKAGEVRAGKHAVLQRIAAAGDEVDDAGGKARFHEDLHEAPAGERRRGRGLPEHHVAAERGRAGQVARDGREVERRHGHDESLERAVDDAVHLGKAGSHGLVGVDPACVGHAEAQEVGEGAGRFTLGLADDLALPEHVGGDDAVAPGTRHERGSLFEDGQAVLGGKRLPGFLGVHGGLDRSGEFLGSGDGELGDNMVVVVREHDGHGLLGVDRLAADDERDALHAGLLAGELVLERRLLG